jgi:uncharacterized Zn finger protein
MYALDGNAIAGPLFEYFGKEMTMARGSCVYCGTSSMIAELPVYTKAPGDVVRCRNCGNVVMVLMTARGSQQLDMTCFVMDDPPRRVG